MTGWFLVGIPLLAIIVLSWWGVDSRPGFGGEQIGAKQHGFVHSRDDRRRI